MKKSTLKYINKEIKNINFKNYVAITGATGSIGEALTEELSYLGANLLLLVRNVEAAKVIKTKFERIYNNHIEIIYYDCSNKESVDGALTAIKKFDVDALINNAGIYHQKYEMIYKHEKTFLTNYLLPVYFTNKLLEEEKFKHIKIVNVCSISYKMKNIDFSDVEMMKTKFKTIHYSNTKRLLMIYSVGLRNNGIDINLAHPGISATNLFNKKNKAYPKIFYVLIAPLCKVLFMGPEKASLSLLKALDSKTLKDNLWVGPRGLFNSWGYPSIQKFSKKILNQKNIDLINSITEVMIKELN